MSDEEWAKTGQEIAKFGTASVEATSKFGGFFAKIIDKPLSELCGKWVDNKKFDRWENQVKIQDRVNTILKERGCENVRMIPPKLGIPLIDNALLEDDENLQDIWCNLIANSLDPNFDKEIRYTLIDMIRNLTPLDALILKYVYEESFNIAKDMVDATNNPVRVVDCRVRFDKMKEKIEAEPREIRISLSNLVRVQCIQEASLRATVNAIKSGIDAVVTLDESYSLTELGIYFIQSCIT
jgi:hypothetical protein